jgi:hypothetical protein
MYDRSFHKGSNTRRLSVRSVRDVGWEIRDERDSHVVRRVLITDWHRAERAVAIFSREEADLIDKGWAVA